ncbi:sulfur carrier protein ThiS [Microbulbifer harenosus]|uniref:Sulfur carrier protein ThiS n=1 Tax=Microbulbifer harenosus TaxID=2576840 RepID=A0ABY2UD61_9GAMM|nr:sulfur carrier protein ThiS [Microbulbifer harenosus]TLM73923.1 sulfur carrier protein ThiS [Microbulbifer harenosus]
MQLMVNGEAITIQPGGKTVECLLQQLGYQGETFAVALNGDFVARDTYGEVALNEGDSVDIVAPVVGG